MSTPTKSTSYSACAGTGCWWCSKSNSGLVRTIRYARNECPQQAFEYYEIPTTQGTYLAVDVLGFVNAPGFEAYRGPIRFRDGFLT